MYRKWSVARAPRSLYSAHRARKCVSRAHRVRKLIAHRARKWRGDMMNIPFINTVATGQNIDKLRIAAGMSVKDMQMVFGFATPQAIYKWIHGTAMPTIDNMVILAAILGVTLDEIVIVDTYNRKCG